MGLTGSQSLELIIGIVVVVVIFCVLYILQVFNRKPTQKNQRSAVIEYRPYPNQPRYQIIINSRPYDYEGFDQSFEDNKLGIAKGTLQYAQDGMTVSFPRKLDMNSDFSIDMERTIKENRVYIKVVEDKEQTNEKLALETARGTIISLERKIAVLEDKIDDLEADEHAKKMDKGMRKGSVLTSRTISSHGQTPKSSWEKIKEAQAQQPKATDDDEDEEEEEDEDGDDFE